MCYFTGFCHYHFKSIQYNRKANYSGKAYSTAESQSKLQRKRRATWRPPLEFELHGFSVELINYIMCYLFSLMNGTALTWARSNVLL